MEHAQAMTCARNGRTRNSRPCPQLAIAPSAAEREAVYYASLKLVARIDDDLTRSTGHYRNKAGELLETLDEVVLAILQDDLMLEPVRELAA